MKKWSNTCALLLAMAVCIYGSVCAQTPPKPGDMLQKGMALIKDGKLNEGLDALKQATLLEPNKPDWHMDYGSILFTIGAQLYQKGNLDSAKPILQESERQLLWATDLFVTPETDPLKAQCFYLLGDIYWHVAKDKQKAKSFYQKALTLYPQHGGALAAMKNIDKQ